MNYWIFSNKPANFYHGSKWDTSSILKSKRWYFRNDDPNARNIRKGDKVVARIYGSEYFVRFSIGSSLKPDPTDKAVGFFEMADVVFFEPAVPQYLLLGKLSNRNVRNKIIEITKEDSDRIVAIQNQLAAAGSAAGAKDKRDAVGPNSESETLAATGLWEQRRMAILKAISQLDRAATSEELLEAFRNGNPLLLSKGRDEPAQKSPEYYFQHALRRVLGDGLATSSDGGITLTAAGRAKLEGANHTKTLRGAIRGLTSRDAVLKAIAEYDRLGADQFREKHGFGPAKTYHLLHAGKYYDSKAIVGVAFGIEHGRPLKAEDFSGGLQTVVPRLKSLGFQVIADQVKKTVGLPEEAEAAEFWEGSKQSVVINRYERNTEAREACIQHYGASCYVCAFDFAAAYGDQFMGFIHVHHIVPVAAKQARYKIDPVKDLRPICPNCHAMIHYGGATRSIDEAKKFVADARQKSRDASA